MAVRIGHLRVVCGAMETSSSSERYCGAERVGLGAGSHDWRCRAAAVSTSVREVEVEAEVQRAALRGSFEAASVSEECRMYYGRRGGGDAYMVTEADVPAEEETDGEMMVAALEAALAGAGRNAESLCEMAMRAWRKLGDADRAEQLFLEALQVAPDNSAVQASYAQFLWQCDA